MIRTVWLIPVALTGLVEACVTEDATRGAAPIAGSAAGTGSAGRAANGGSGAATAGGGAGSPSNAGSGGNAGLSGAENTAGSSASAGSAGRESTAGAAGAADVGLSPERVPGENFDLTHWALQLPVASGNSVEQIKDLSSYTSVYFFSGPDGAMTFWCPVTGATTPNTHYPRTELRELPVGGDWDITGHHRLTAQLKMLQNPPSKGTVIGQIHGNATGGTSEVLKLEWMSDNQLVASVEANDDPAKQLNHTLGTYKLGELLSYTAELQDSMLTVSVTNDAGTQSYTTPYTAGSWQSDKYYFKLGAYVQLDSGTDQQGGRVAFYAVAVEHTP